MARGRKPKTDSKSKTVKVEVKKPTLKEKLMGKVKSVKKYFVKEF